MGCDIHAMVVYRRRGDSYDTFPGTAFNPGRSYTMFGRLAGVRIPELAMFGKPRGTRFEGNVNAMPWELAEEITRRVVPDNTEGLTADGLMHSDGRWWAVSERRSAGWRKIEGASEPLVWHPDYHSHSWLLPSEWRKAVEAHGDAQPGYYAILAAAEAYEARGHEAWIEFWFDN